MWVHTSNFLSDLMAVLKILLWRILAFLGKNLFLSIRVLISSILLYFVYEVHEVHTFLIIIMRYIIQRMKKVKSIAFFYSKDSNILYGIALNRPLRTWKIFKKSITFRGWMPQYFQKVLFHSFFSREVCVHRRPHRNFEKS